MPNLVRQIEFGGPMTVASYMQTVLAHPGRGYYTTRDPLDQELKQRSSCQAEL